MGSREATAGCEVDVAEQAGGRGSTAREASNEDTGGSLQGDQLEYMADMILELQRMAAKAGQHMLAQRLLAAYEVAVRRA